MDYKNDIKKYLDEEIKIIKNLIHAKQSAKKLSIFENLTKLALFPPNSQPDGNNSHYRHDVPISPQHIVVQLPTSDKWVLIHCFAPLSFYVLPISLQVRAHCPRLPIPLPRSMR